MNPETDVRNGRFQAAIAKFDGIIKRASMRRRESIRQSMARPLRVEILRTGYIVGCVMVDTILIPIAMIELMGRQGLFISILILVPLLYVQHRLHINWFEGDRLFSHSTAELGEESD